jgi:hypothetical protein
MSSTLTIHRQISFTKRARGHRSLGEGASKSLSPPGRVPRVARLMALAIRFDGLLRDGVVADQAKLARLGHVTRARMAQIMNLLNLAPDIQEEILFLPMVETGRSRITERDLRPVAAEPNWRKQRWMWARVRE